MTFPRQGCWIWLHCILRVSVSSRSHVSKHSAPLLDASHLGDCCRDGKHRWSPAAPLTSPIKLKQPGEATSQCAQQRFSKLPADGRDVGRLGTTRYYKNGNLNQWWLRKSMLKLINIFGLGPGWGSPILPMSPQRSRAAMTCCSTAFWANVRRCTFYAAEDLPEKTEQLHSLRWRLWLHAFGCRQLTHSLMTPKGQKIDWDQIGNEPQVEWFSTVTDNSWKCSLWLSAMTCSTGASVERHPFYRCVE